MITNDLPLGVLLWTGKILSTVLLADLYSGLLHWWLDVYGNPNWTFMNIGKVLIKPSHTHHTDQRKMLKVSYWQRNKIKYLFAAVVSLFIFLIGVNILLTLIFFLLAAHTSEFHAMAHRNKKENGKLITLLQKMYLIPDGCHHRVHHIAPHNTYFCVVTRVLNPILDKMKFWEFLEYYVFYITGIMPLNASVSEVEKPQTN